MEDRDSSQERASIGMRLRQARELAGLSQGQVAKLMGLHRPAISEIEAGRRKVSVEELKQMSELYDVSMVWLGEGSDNEDEDSARVLLAARELAKLKPSDLDSLLSLLTILRKSGSDTE